MIELAGLRRVERPADDQVPRSQRSEAGFGQPLITPGCARGTGQNSSPSMQRGSKP